MKYRSTVAFALILSCGTTAEPQEAGIDAGAEVSADAGVDVVEADVMDGGSWHYIDGGGTCAPDATAYSYRSCCNGQPCFGNCVQNDVGDVQCNCAGISGGCTGGLVCCKVPPACVADSKCGLGQ